MEGRRKRREIKKRRKKTRKRERRRKGVVERGVRDMNLQGDPVSCGGGTLLLSRVRLGPPCAWAAWSP